LLTRIDGARYAEEELAAMQAPRRNAETGTWSELWSPTWRPVLMLGLALAILQQITGINVFLYYAPEIFKQLGSTGESAFLQTIVIGAVNLIFTVVAIGTVDRVGRRPLLMAGAAGMGICLVATGLATQTGAVAGWVLLFVLGYIACFALAVGPVTWVVLTEIFPTRLRGSALALATFALWTANFLVSQTFPMMDENVWLRARFGPAFPLYLYAFFAAVLVWVIWRHVPETKGRSLEDIERGWR
jgi:sugar porter (SP) family MFS transporter